MTSQNKNSSRAGLSTLLCCLYGTFAFRLGAALFTRACQYQLLQKDRVQLFANSETLKNIGQAAILQIVGVYFDRAGKKYGLQLFVVLETIAVGLNAALAAAHFGTPSAAVSDPRPLTGEAAGGLTDNAYGLLALQMSVQSLASVVNFLASLVPSLLNLQPEELLQVNAWDVSLTKVARALAPILVGVLLPIFPFSEWEFPALLAGMHLTALVAKTQVMRVGQRRASMGAIKVGGRGAGSEAAVEEELAGNVNEDKSESQELAEKSDSSSVSSSEVAGRPSHVPTVRRRGLGEKHSHERTSPSAQAQEQETDAVNKNDPKTPALLSDRNKFRLLLLCAVNTGLTNLVTYPMQSIVLPVLFKSRSAAWMELTSLLQSGALLGPFLSSFLVSRGSVKGVSLESLPHRLSFWCVAQGGLSAVLCAVLLLWHAGGEGVDAAQTRSGGGIWRGGIVEAFQRLLTGETESRWTPLLPVIWGCLVCANNCFTIYFTAFLNVGCANRGKVLANCLTFWQLCGALGNALLGWGLGGSDSVGSRLFSVLIASALVSGLLRLPLAAIMAGGGVISGTGSTGGVDKQNLLNEQSPGKAARGEATTRLLRRGKDE